MSDRNAGLLAMLGANPHHVIAALDKMSRPSAIDFWHEFWRLYLKDAEEGVRATSAERP